MTTIEKLIAKRPWISHIDDERDLDQGIIVTLHKGWCFTADRGCGVYGFDTMKEVIEGTSKDSVYKEA